MAKQVAKKAAKRKTAAKRELIDTGKEKRYVRRSKSGTFKKVVEVGRSLAADRRSKSKTAAKKGQGDRGDQKKA